MREMYSPELGERVLALYEHAKGHSSRLRLGSTETSVWMGLHEDPDQANPVVLTFWHDARNVCVNMAYFHDRRTPDEMERLVELLRELRGTSETLDQAVAKGYRSFCAFPTESVLAADEDLEAFKAVLDQAAVRATRPFAD
jgi:hypothetical protein